MKKFTLMLVTLLAITMNLSATNKEHVVFLGEHAIGKWDWSTRLEIDGYAFNELTSGDVITISLTEDIAAATAASELYYQYNVSIAVGEPYPTIESGDMSSETMEITMAPTDEQISQIKANKLVVNGHFVKVNKVMYGKTNQSSVVVDPADLPFSTGEWDGPVLNLDLETLKTAKVGDKIVFDINSTFITLERDYCQAFIYFGSPSIGSSDLKDQTRKEYVLTADDITNIAAAPDAKLYGKGVVLNNVYLETRSYIYLLDANVTLPAALNGVTAEVDLYRKFDWSGTICLPFNLADLSAFPTGIKVYEFKKYDSGLVFTEREHISAGVPYYMTRPYDVGITEEEKYMTISLGTVTINTTLNDSDPSNGITFKGNYESGMSMVDKYGVAWGGSSWGFYKGGTNSKLNAYAAYFDGSLSSARLGIVIDDETTGIKNLTQILSEGDGIAFDLQGRKVAQPTKGLYIVNGKKVVIK